MRNLLSDRFCTSVSSWFVCPIVVIVGLSTLAFDSGRQAFGLTIQMNFQSGLTDYPAYDPDGTRLVALMGEVADYWADIIEAPGTLNVNFSYDELASGILASHNSQSTSGGKPTQCRIRFNTNRTWYIDETPFENSEYNMTQTLIGDLTDTKRSNYFSGALNDLMEVSYNGIGNYSQSGVSGAHDMWSIALHEMGHGLGLTSSVAWGEASDRDYDIDPDLAWGSATEIECYSNDNTYHLAATSLMYQYAGQNRRQLPSATDTFAIEAAAEWGDGNIDLMRKDFYSTSANANLNIDANWAGNKRPDSTRDAAIRDGGVATLSADLTVNELVVSGATTVYTNTYRLHADQNCVLGDGTNVGTVEIDSGGEFQVDKQLAINNGSKVSMDLGSLLDVDDLRIEVGGEVVCAGTIDIANSMYNNGKITVSGGNLTINSIFVSNSATSTLLIEADGNQSSDFINVNGNASIGGTLDMNFIDGYSPVYGDWFEIMSYTSYDGEFDSILWDNPAINLTATYGATSLLIHVSVPEPGGLVLVVLGMLACLAGRLRQGR